MSISEILSTASSISETLKNMQGHPLSSSSSATKEPLPVQRDLTKVKLVLVLCSNGLEEEEYNTLTAMGKVHEFSRDDLFNNISEYSKGLFDFLVVDLNNEDFYSWVSRQNLSDDILSVGHVRFFEKELELLNWSKLFKCQRLIQTLPLPQPSFKQYLEKLITKRIHGKQNILILFLLWLKKKLVSL